MTDKESSESRRKLLKSIAVGSGAVFAGKQLPQNWSRPVVNSVVLPAHAQTSGRTFTGTGNVNFGFNNNSNSMVAGLADALVPSAHAGEILFQEEYAGCVTEVAGGLDVWITYLVFPDFYQLRELHGVIPTTGGDLAELITDCGGSGNSIYIGTTVLLTDNSITLSPQFYPPVTLYLASSCVEKLILPPCP